MKNTELEIVDIIKDTLNMLIEDRQHEIDKIENTMNIMLKVIDNDDVWSYSVGDTTADELYIKVKKAAGQNNYVSHDIFMNTLIDWMFHLGKEEE